MTPALFRLTIFNICGAAGLIAAWRLGYVQQVVNGDVSRISYIIAAVFAVALAATFWRPAKTAWLTDVTEWLVTLGLIGNVVGFIIALHGIDANASDMQAVALNLMHGMGVAFYSTATGAVLALWTSVNRRILHAG